MEAYNERTIRRSISHIVMDEFDDQAQNEHIYDRRVSGHDELMVLLYQQCPEKSQTYILNVGSAGQRLAEDEDPERIVFNLEPNAKRNTGDGSSIPGWAENIVPDLQNNRQPSHFDIIVSWGVLCFLRSLPEALIEFNDHLKIGGKLVVDVVAKTVMPLAQTSDPDSFVRYMQLYGFELEHRIPFGIETHVREGFRFKKVRDFDSTYLRIPQCTDKINNFLWERDWFLR